MTTMKWREILLLERELRYLRRAKFFPSPLAQLLDTVERRSLQHYAVLVPLDLERFFSAALAARLRRVVAEHRDRVKEEIVILEQLMRRLQRTAKRQRTA